MKKKVLSVAIKGLRGDPCGDGAVWLLDCIDVNILVDINYYGTMINYYLVDINYYGTVVHYYTCYFFLLL